MGRYQQFKRQMARLAKAEVGGGKVAVTLLVALVAVSGLLMLGFRSATGFVDGLDRQHERQQVANYIERQTETSVGQLKVQLTWDEAFRRIGSGPIDARWADAYVGDFLWTNFGYDRLYVVDPHGNMLRGWVNGRLSDEHGYDRLHGQVGRLLKRMASRSAVFGVPTGSRQLADTRWQLGAKGRPLTRWDHSLVRLDGIPAMMTLVSVLPDTDLGLLQRTPNHLVAVRLLDGPFLEQLSQQLLLARPRVADPMAGQSDDNSLRLVRSDGMQIGVLTWRSQLRSQMVRERVRPIFAAYFCFLIALLIGGFSLFKALRRALQRLKQREAQAQHEARHDAMTGLPNRTSFVDQLEKRLARLATESDTALAVAFFDIDHFKYINDTLGHPAGDALVRQVAERCRRRLPDSDLLARLGGDEFVVMRCAPRNEGGITRLGEDLMAVFAAPFNVDGRVIDVTASCGISWAPEQGNCAEDLLRNADIALFRAKQRGRARWRAFTREMEGTVRRRLLLELELRKALQGNKLSLAYQPIVEAEDGTITGAEALLRWEHQELGPLSPALFIPVAEQAGLMPLVGWWTIGRVFEQRRVWPQVDISINLSPLQLTARGFLDDLAVLVEEYRVDPRGITFEVTEGILLERGSGVFAVLEGLKAMGFGVALDDFGTGYSSLSYLRAFAFDRIKIDRSFVQNIENDLDAQAILKAIVSLGKSLRTRTVAEGVETPLQRDLVCSAGCDLIQGFLFHRPMPAEDFASLLDAKARPRAANPVRIERRRRAG